MNLLTRSTLIEGASPATSATHAALEIFRNPDAALLIMLKKGLVTLDLAWYEVLFGILPYASLFLLAASPHFHGGLSPTVLRFTRTLPTLS